MLAEQQSDLRCHIKSSNVIYGINWHPAWLPFAAGSITSGRTSEKGLKTKTSFKFSDVDFCVNFSFTWKTITENFTKLFFYCFRYLQNVKNRRSAWLKINGMAEVVDRERVKQTKTQVFKQRTCKFKKSKFPNSICAYLSFTPKMKSLLFVVFTQNLTFSQK